MRIPSSRNILRIVLGLIALGVIALAGIKLAGFIAADSCLDNGGRWNSHTGVCETR